MMPVGDQDPGVCERGGDASLFLFSARQPQAVPHSVRGSCVHERSVLCRLGEERINRLGRVGVKSKDRVEVGGAGFQQAVTILARSGHRLLVSKYNAFGEVVQAHQGENAPPAQRFSTAGAVFLLVEVVGGGWISLQGTVPAPALEQVSGGAVAVGSGFLPWQDEAHEVVRVLRAQSLLVI